MKLRYVVLAILIGAALGLAAVPVVDWWQERRRRRKACNSR